MRFALVALVMAFGCRVEPTPSAPAKPESRAAAADPTVEPERDAEERCIPLVERDVVAEAFAKGAAQLEASRDGEHYRVQPFEAGIDTLRIAAQNGHLEAQSLYGRTVFSTRFMAQAPRPEEREDYVSAIAFLRIASKAGEEQANGFLPGIEGEASAVEEPLDTLPEGWVGEAFARADAWIDCYGLPQPGGSLGEP